MLVLSALCRKEGEGALCPLADSLQHGVAEQLGNPRWKKVTVAQALCLIIIKIEASWCNKRMQAPCDAEQSKSMKLKLMLQKM